MVELSVRQFTVHVFKDNITLTTSSFATKTATQTLWPDNHLRLTGLRETQAIDKLGYGLFDRRASVRLPVNFIKNGYKGCLEDRRPDSEGDPYQIVSRILDKINSVPKP